MEGKMTSKKRGQLSLQEEKFIRENFQSLSIDEIANILNRGPKPVQRYIDENNLLALDSN